MSPVTCPPVHRCTLSIRANTQPSYQNSLLCWDSQVFHPILNGGYLYLNITMSRHMGWLSYIGWSEEHKRAERGKATAQEGEEGSNQCQGLLIPGMWLQAMSWPSPPRSTFPWPEFLIYNALHSLTDSFLCCSTDHQILNGRIILRASKGIWDPNGCNLVLRKIKNWAFWMGTLSHLRGTTGLHEMDKGETMSETQALKKKNRTHDGKQF